MNRRLISTAQVLAFSIGLLSGPASIAGGKDITSISKDAVDEACSALGVESGMTQREMQLQLALKERAKVIAETGTLEELNKAKALAKTIQEKLKIDKELKEKFDRLNSDQHDLFSIPLELAAEQKLIPLEAKRNRELLSILEELQTTFGRIASSNPNTVLDHVKANKAKLNSLYKRYKELAEFTISPETSALMRSSNLWNKETAGTLLRTMNPPEHLRAYFEGMTSMSHEEFVKAIHVMQRKDKALAAVAARFECVLPGGSTSLTYYIDDYVTDRDLTAQFDQFREFDRNNVARLEADTKALETKVARLEVANARFPQAQAANIHAAFHVSDSSEYAAKASQYLSTQYEKLPGMPTAAPLWDDFIKKLEEYTKEHKRYAANKAELSALHEQAHPILEKLATEVGESIPERILKEVELKEPRLEAANRAVAMNAGRVNAEKKLAESLAEAVKSIGAKSAKAVKCVPFVLAGGLAVKAVIDSTSDQSVKATAVDFSRPANADSIHSDHAK
jgi:hypothetical protein